MSLLTLDSFEVDSVELSGSGRRNIQPTCGPYRITQNEGRDLHGDQRHADEPVNQGADADR